MELEQWLGKDNQLGIDIWNGKYRYNNETFDEWLDRVSNGDEELKQLIFEKKFLFGGRTLSNYNTNNGSSTSNCYSSGYAPDDTNGILELNKNIGLTYKAQGGQGISLSKIRPKGSSIKSGEYVTDGIIPFMEIFNTTTTSISQGGSRKGALMLSLDAWHKEAYDFITIKSEQGKIEKANLSLEVDDEFMNCVEKYYETGEEITVHRVFKFDSGKIEYDVTPIKLYKKMCEICYDWAEPAFIYTNRFRNYNMMQYVDDYEIVTGNPCVTGDTKILTDKGYFEIIQLVGKETNIWNGYKFSKVVPTKTGENQELFKISFSNGSVLRCTPYHKFILNDGERIECKNLKIGDKLIKCEFPIIQGKKVLENAYTQGFFSGDGFICKDRKAKYISLYGVKRNLSEYISIINRREKGKDRDTYSINVSFDKEFVPNAEYSIDSRLRWLEGIIDSDGSGNGEDISITSINFKFMDKIKFMLNTLGIDCTFSKCKDGGKKMFKEELGNKEYYCKDLYRIVISLSDVISLNKLGFSPKRVKNTGIPNRNAKRFITITNIEKLDFKEDVYCFTEEDNHSGIFNGVITAQCGEQPLPKNGACNLGSINLSEFVYNPYTSSSKFEIDEFSKAVRIAIRGLDKVIDYGYKYHALKEQQDMACNYRNIGLGIMGFGSMLFKMGIKYGSKSSKELIDNILKIMFREAVLESNKLAKELGTFPRYEDNVLHSDIIKNHFSHKEMDELRQYGLRNCSLLSIAPSGSIGTMLNVTTGCEPAFRISYQRKTESLHKGEEVFYQVYIDEAKEYMKFNSASELPDYFIGSDKVDWKDRVEIQSIMQNHVDTAISSTVNLPNKTKIEEIEQLYLLAWKLGIKGITIYRDGCSRGGILTTNNSQKETKPSKGLEWGTILQVDNDVIGKKRKIQTGCGSLHVTAFFDNINGQLLECYLSKGSTGGCNQFMIGLSRMISLSARAGVGIDAIIDQLNSCGSCPSYAVRSATKHDTSKGSCCPMAVGYALRDMYNEMQEELGNEDEEELKQVSPKNKAPKCPECGEDLSFEGGCNICKSCGYSKCD